MPARKPQAEPVQTGMRRTVVKAPAEQAYVALAFRVPALQNLTEPGTTDRDALALVVLSAVLSGYDGARLERALTQGSNRIADNSSRSASVMGRGPAQFFLSGVPAQGQRAEALQARLLALVARVSCERGAPHAPAPFS